MRDQCLCVFLEAVLGGYGEQLQQISTSFVGLFASHRSVHFAIQKVQTMIVQPRDSVFSSEIQQQLNVLP